jgi:hypothetical protein
MIALPLLAPVVKATLALPSPGVARRLVGASGAADGVTLFDATDAAVCHVLRLAVAVNVYAIPRAKPLTTQDGAGAVMVQLNVLSCTEVTVYEVGDP